MKADAVKAVDEVVWPGQLRELHFSGVKDRDIRDFIVPQHVAQGIEITAKRVLEPRSEQRIASDLAVPLIGVDFAMRPAQLLCEKDQRSAEAGTDFQYLRRPSKCLQQWGQSFVLPPTGAILFRFPKFPAPIAGRQGELRGDLANCCNQLWCQWWSTK